MRSRPLRSMAGPCSSWRPQLRADKEVVLKAVNNDGWALQWADQVLFSGRPYSFCRRSGRIGSWSRRRFVLFL